MNASTGWFIAGLIMLALLGMYAPKFAGVFVILIVTVLAVESAHKGLI